MKMEDFSARVMIATPSYTGEVHHLFAHSALISQLDCLMRGIFIDWQFAAGFSLVQFARNYLVHQFLRDDTYTHLMWIDADLGWRPDAVRRLVERNLDAVGGVYTTKSPTNPIFPYMAVGPVENGLQEVSRLPGGFLLLTRRAVEAVVAKCRTHKLEHDGKILTVPYVFELVLNGEDLLGEDYVFCARLRDAGFKLYAETDIDFQHFGLNAWHGNLATVLAAEAAKGIDGQSCAEAQALNITKHAQEDQACRTKRNKTWESSP